MYPEPLKRTVGGIKDENMSLFKKEDDYYKPIRVGKFWNNSYIEYKCSGDRSKNLSLKDYLNKMKPYLRDIIINLQKFDSWKI